MSDALAISALIVGTLALIVSVCCISIMLAKNFFSSHSVQMVPVDPMKQFQDLISPDIGRPMDDTFRDLSDPLDSDELEHLELMKQKREAMKAAHVNKDLV